MQVYHQRADFEPIDLVLFQVRTAERLSFSFCLLVLNICLKCADERRRIIFCTLLAAAYGTGCGARTEEQRR
jgi:hypothetical protein